MSMPNIQFTPTSFSIVPADTQVHYSGVPLPSPFQDYPLGRLPDTVVMRRSKAQRVLHRLLVQHPTATNITLLGATVRGFQASADMASIQSVSVRTLDGTQLALNDVALVVGKFVCIAVHFMLLVSFKDCTGMTQAGLKWLKSAGFSLPENTRCSYNGNLHYATLCFTVPPELEAMLPIPPDKGAMLYNNIQHAVHGDAIFGLFKTDNNTSTRAASLLRPYSPLFHLNSAIITWGRRECRPSASRS